MVGFEPFFYFIIDEVFVLSLSYLEMRSDESFANAELNRKFSKKSSKKRPGSPVIDMLNKNRTMVYLYDEEKYFSLYSTSVQYAS